ncbi:MAG: AtpZ/AtpI family protein [Candidatus Marinimicrobia bacterium]|nr:AtpZ/AtpI family protein [Candidatus Neomarinimicrobiota bacterium]
MKRDKNWQRLSSVGINFVIMVLLCAWIGSKLDGKFETTPYITLAATFFGIFAASYHLIITVKNLDK